jgi:hypothetical protein
MSINLLDTWDMLVNKAKHISLSINDPKKNSPLDLDLIAIAFGM